MEEPIIAELAETENFNLWQAEEPDGETTYHLELGIATLHFFREEWEELLGLMIEEREKREVYNLELDMVTIHFTHSEWKELQELIAEAREYVGEE